MRSRAGAPVETTLNHLWTVREGKLAVLEMFPGPQEALEAAGLRQ